MKKIINILLALIMTLSLTACSGSVSLEEGQGHFIFTEDGEVTMNGYIDEDELEDEFDIDMDDDEDDILDDMQDYFEDGFEELAEILDVDFEVEVEEIKKEKDGVSATIIFSDFEFIIEDWYEKLEDLADEFGDFEDLADEIDFVTYQKEDDVDEDDLEDYEDNFVIQLDGQDEGMYYEFPTEILLVDEDIKFERISDTIIFVEDGEVGYVVVEEALDGEKFDPYSMFGDMDSDDDDLDKDDLNDLDGFGSGDEADYGNPNNLQMGQKHMAYNSDGTYIESGYLSNEDIQYEFEIEIDVSRSSSEIIEDIETHYNSNYSTNLQVNELEKRDEGIYYSFEVPDPTDIDGDYGYLLSEQSEWYGGYEGVLDSYEIIDVNTKELLSVSQLEDYGDHYAFFISDYFNGAYYTFPTDIELVDSLMTWALVDSKTIYIENWSHGLVVY